MCRSRCRKAANTSSVRLASRVLWARPACDPLQNAARCSDARAPRALPRASRPSRTPVPGDGSALC
eukprot:11570237-Karenia_brevis.AAC.1